MIQNRNPLETKILKNKQIKKSVDYIRSLNKSIALCHGVFDLLHLGHIRHLAKAKESADILVVSITADQFVNKGPGRPVFSENQRAEALAHLECVDYVIISNATSAAGVLEDVKPNFYFKGQEYSEEKKDKTKNIVIEKKIVESNGGKIIFTEEIVFSSSNLINNFLSTQSEEVTSWIKEIKSKYSVDEILRWLERIDKLKVMIIGETIIDKYTYCEVLGKSAKEPILCINKGETQAHAGGILSIGANLAGLGVETKIITGFNKKDYTSSVIKNLVHKGINIDFIDIYPSPTIIKERLVDQRTSNRIIELYEMNDAPLNNRQEEKFIKYISNNLRDIDAIIIADYGHGLLSNNIISYLCQVKKFLAVNVQVNAGNRGFNSVSRYPKIDFLTLNGSEARLEAKRRNLSFDILIKELSDFSKTNQILVTHGGSGLSIYSNKGEITHSPALASYVKDRVGAGDAVLTITSLLSYIKAPTDIIGFFGAIIGAWAVSFTGNEKSLDVGTITRYVKSFLA